MDNYKICSNVGFMLELWKKLPEARASGKPDATTFSSWSYDMEGHAKKCVEKYCELANKNNSTKLQRNAWMTTKFKEEEMGSVGELSTICSQIVLKCLYLARIGRYLIFYGP